MKAEKREILRNNFESYESNDDIEKRIEQALIELENLEEEVKVEEVEGFIIKKSRVGEKTLFGIAKFFEAKYKITKRREGAPKKETSEVCSDEAKKEGVKMEKGSVVKQFVDLMKDMESQSEMVFGQIMVLNRLIKDGKIEVKEKKEE